MSALSVHLWQLPQGLRIPDGYLEAIEMLSPVISLTPQKELGR